uniref:VWFA domain-containing protein n=1 Tax=Pelusios castaneus TaxID=367368 RepID=A0A8C8SB03_9SAUR
GFCLWLWVETLISDCLTPAVLATTHGFSVDVERPITFQGAAAGFGQSVVQFGSAGACGPTVHQVCGENMYLKGYCFLLDQKLQQLQRIPDNLAECPRHDTDIALLIDGSGSIRSDDFRKMKTFISAIMKRFHSTDTQFALMQYSDSFKQHFDFTKYKESRDTDHLVSEVLQLRGWTQTATAIQKVVQEVFTPQRGARKDATKILIVITDGRKEGDRLSYSDVIPEAENAGIIRYAIGVGSAFSTPNAQYELHQIASQPTREHVFRVDNFDALQGIQNQLQEKIFAIEGTQSQNGSSFQLEMSQEGFSSLLSPDGAVLGAVGAYDWSGGIFLYGSGRELSFINVSRTSTDMNDAYLGYSSQVVTGNGQSSYVVGAPRYQHTGKVILFSRDAKGGDWMPRSELLGEQIGSYFGGTLCAVDLDRDGNTDVVLVGAPMYHTPQNGGRVYVCPINGLVRKRSETLQGQTGEVFGHFGASMSEIGDISGDGQMDVAIGAPLENNNHGAVYIFHGENRGFNSQYRQVKGAQFPSRLHYFGQAVSGGTDLTGDGLPDIAVGAGGQVLLLRSRPVLRVGVSFRFQPPTIPTLAFNCQEQEQFNTEASRADVCFTVIKNTKDSLGDRLFSTIQYSLALDPGRTKIRAAFDSTHSVQSGELRLGIEQRCETYPIILPVSVESPGSFPSCCPLLPWVSPQLPFQKDCGQDGQCDDQLEMSFNFSGLSTLVVGVTPELNTIVSIQNRGENSYSTRVRFFYPAALSYRRVLLVQVQPHTTHARHNDRTQGRSLRVCREWVGAIFIATFDVSAEANLGDRLQITANECAMWGQGIALSLCMFPAQLTRCVCSHLSLLSSPAGESSLCMSQQPFPLGANTDSNWGLGWRRDASRAHPQSHPTISFHPQDCSVATCKKIRCTIASLEMQQPLEFTIEGKISFQWVSQWSLVGESRDGWMVPGLLGPRLMAFLPQVETVVESYEVYNYLPIIVGSSVGGLVLLVLIIAALYKVRGAGLGPLSYSLSPRRQDLARFQLDGGMGKGLSFGGSCTLPVPSSAVSLSVCLSLSQSASSVSCQVGFFKRQYKQKMEDAVGGEGAGRTQSATTDNPPTSDAPK